MPPKNHKLNWEVQKEGGKFKRRKLAGDDSGIDFIDVRWTHTDGFPPAKICRPVSYNYATKEHVFEEVNDGGRRDVILDQISVPPNTSDETIAHMLDGKRERLAADLKIEP